MSFFLGDAVFESLFHVKGMSLGPSLAGSHGMWIFMGFLEITSLHEEVNRGVNLHEQPPYDSELKSIN